MSKYNEKLVVNNIRSLGIDMINNASSGHPGIVLGAAPIMHSLFSSHLKFNSQDPTWCNRDRFIMSAGHGSALLYATLFMNGYDYDIADLKKFRSIASKTPGHPEYNPKLGIETTTGPLGQGLATALGMAMAQKHLEATYNTKKYKIFDYHIYVLCGEGDLMEGISYEAASLASNLNLNNLILLYDCNKITLDGASSLSFNENIITRFEALGWNTIDGVNGEKIKDISAAIKQAKKSKKPTIILVNTTIGKFSKYENTNKVHGTPLEINDISNIKKKLKLDDTPFAYDSENHQKYLSYLNKKNTKIYDNWQKQFNEYLSILDKDKKHQLLDIVNNEKVDFKLENILNIDKINSELSMRDINGLIMSQIANHLPRFIGGAADTVSSTKTYLQGQGDFNYKNYKGKNIYFGIREHAMGAITNGLALSNFKSFSSTFLTFSDYMKPAIRLSALMNIPSTFIFTHDSINIGQDGPTHQPIEQLTMLRSIPNFTVYRPCDIQELIGCWNNILAKNEPCSLIISRNKTKQLTYSNPTYVKYGGYIVEEFANNFDIILLASGSEVSLALEVAEKLKEENIESRVISVPNLNILLNQNPKIIQGLLPTGIKKYVIEYSNDPLWYKLDKDIELININTFGLSGPSNDVINHFELDSKSIFEKIYKSFKS